MELTRKWAFFFLLFLYIEALEPCKCTVVAHWRNLFMSSSYFLRFECIIIHLCYEHFSPTEHWILNGRWNAKTLSKCSILNVTFSSLKETTQFVYLIVFFGFLFSLVWHISASNCIDHSEWVYIWRFLRIFCPSDMFQTFYAISLQWLFWVKYICGWVQFNVVWTMLKFQCKKTIHWPFEIHIQATCNCVSWCEQHENMTY